MKEWFKYDYDAADDPKVIELRIAFGMAGLGLWVFVLGKLYKSNGKLMDCDIPALAYTAQVPMSEFSAFVLKCVQIGLLTFDSECNFYANGRCTDALLERTQRSNKATTAVRTRYERSTNVEHSYTDIDIDKSIDKEKSKSITVHKNEPSALAVAKVAFSVPEVAQVCEYMTTIGLTPEDGEAFHDHYTANGWKVGKNPMKSWQSACRNWKRNKTTYGGNNARPNKRGDRNTDGSIDIVGYDQRIKRVLESARAQRQGTGGVVPSVPEKVNGLETGDLDRRNSLGMVVGDSGDGIQLRGNDGL